MTRDRRDVHLHIGMMKSGTSYLQHGLRQRRASLLERQLLFPMDPDYRQQVAAVRDLLRLPGPFAQDELLGAWQRLTDVAKAWPGNSVLSVEHLSLATHEHIEQVVGSLAPLRARAVITARDLARVLPSTWQENMQNGLTWSWQEFCAAITSGPPEVSAHPAAQRFWRQHDLTTIASRWCDVLGSDQVTVVTVGRSATPDLLWSRFALAIGTDLGAAPIADAVARNASMDYSAAEALRRLNLRLSGSLDRATYAEYVKRPIAKQLLVARSTGEPPQLPTAAHIWVTDHCEQVVQRLSDIGIRVVGDLHDLLPEPVSSPHGSIATPTIDTDARIAEFATEAAAELVRSLADRLADRDQSSSDRAGRAPAAEARRRGRNKRGGRGLDKSARTRGSHR